MELTETEVKKQLYKSKALATLSHYVSGSLYYNIELEDGVYQFPISTIEEDYEWVNNGDGPEEMKIISLSSDLGTTSFFNQMKGSDLNRWISKAIQNEEFIKIN